FVDAERRIVLAKDLADFRFHPRELTEFKSVAMLSRQDLQQALQPLRVYLPFGRKLKQNRTKLLAQMFRARQQIIKRVLRIFQFLVVCDKPAGFHRKYKISGSGIFPGLKGFNGRQAIKTVVELQSVE